VFSLNLSRRMDLADWRHDCHGAIQAQDCEEIIPESVLRLGRNECARMRRPDSSQIQGGRREGAQEEEGSQIAIN